jgi:hypothetical protein
VHQPIGRQDSLQSLIRTSRRLDSFLHEAAQNFEVFKYSRVKFKNPKPIVVDVLLKACAMVPLSCRSNLAGLKLYCFTTVQRFFSEHHLVANRHPSFLSCHFCGKSIPQGNISDLTCHLCDFTSFFGISATRIFTTGKE